MADSASTRHALLLMETGAHDNTWGIELNDVIQDIEDMVKGSRATATTGGTTTLTTTTSREPLQRVTGVLVSNAIIEVPAAATSWWFFKNETTGAFTLTVKVTGQTGILVRQGETKMLRCNGTDVVDGGLPSRAQRDMIATVGGTVDAITLAFLPAFVVYPVGIFFWVSPGANTITNPVAAIDGLGNKTIVKSISSALAVGDTGAAGYLCMGYYNGTNVVLLNPAGSAVNLASIAAIAAGKKGIWIDASAMRAKATNGADFADYDSGSNDVSFRAAYFDPTTQQYVHFKMLMPQIWNEGTVTFKPVWTNTAGLTTENVVWSLSGVAISNDDTLNAAQGTVQTSNDTWLAQNDQHTGPESSAITIAGTPAAGDLVVFEVSRVVASDNLTGDAILLGIMLYITTDAFNES